MKLDKGGVGGKPKKKKERKEERKKREKGKKEVGVCCHGLLPRRNSRTPKVFFYFRGKSLGFYTSKH